MSWRLAAFAVWNAITYASLLPLWDGFDEPFHYAYIQHLRTAHAFPVLGETAISDEIWRSLALAPASRIVHQNIPVAIPYDVYFGMTETERRGLQAKLKQIDPSLASIETGALNYEAHQAPLAYALLVPFDWALARAPLPSRVWALRFVCATASALLTVLALLRLAHLLGLTEPWRWMAAFLAASLQMFYATTAHVANDWLAVPLFILWLASTVDLARLPDWRRLAWCVGALTAGLLTKAYFLSAIPVTIVVAAISVRKFPKGGWRRPSAVILVCLAAAGLWYGRNARLYQSISGMQEVKGGAPLSKLFDAARRAPWGRTIDTTAHGMIWTGNNSDTSFHRRTVNAMLALLAAGMVAFLVKRRWRAADLVVTGALVSYVAALGYSTAMKVFSTGGVGIAPSAWYVTPLLLATFCIAAAGLAPIGRAGKAIGIAMLALWAYVILATYWFKLLPLYTGYPEARARLIDLWRWQTGTASSTTAIPAGDWIYAAIGVSSIAAIGIVGCVSARLRIWGPEK